MHETISTDHPHPHPAKSDHEKNTDSKNSGGVLAHLGDYVEEPFTIIESYFQGKHLERLVRHQIESYNHFIHVQIQRTIAMFNPVIIRSENDYVEKHDKYKLELQLQFLNFKLYPPQIHENNGATKRMLPCEAKLRNFTYASMMTVDLQITCVVRDTPAALHSTESPKILTKTIPKLNIGKMPIMLKSAICQLHPQNQTTFTNPAELGECPLDCGGYFILKGSEKTVLGQERAAENRVYCFDGAKTTKWSWYAEIKSIPDFKCISPKQIEMMISNKNNGFGFPLYVVIPRIKQPISLFVVFRALGIVSDKEICEYILLDVDGIQTQTQVQAQEGGTLEAEMLAALQASIVDANRYMTKDEALRHLTSYVAYTPMHMDKERGAKKKQEFTLDVLANDLFPHCRTPKQKLYMLGYMTRRLLMASMGLMPPDDRDSYINKRIELTGTLLNNLFRNYFNKLVKEMQKQIVREINNGSWRTKMDFLGIINSTNIYKIMKATTIENGLNRALSTGDFSTKQANSSKVGVAQVLNRLTYAASVSHSRRINTPLEKSGELIPPRKLHNSTFGFLCPAESPEGQSIGIVKNISYMAHITIPTNSASLYAYIMPQIVSVDAPDIGPRDLAGKHNVFVFINGAMVGVTSSPKELYADLKSKKSQGMINIYTSITFNIKLREIRVCNDGGRLTRPLLRVNPASGKAVVTKDVIRALETRELGWNDLLTNCRLDEAVLEYIDPEEQNFAMIAMKGAISDTTTTPARYTHCEIHPSTIFGVLASCIPFPEHNQSPRNCYQTCMAKQSIGIYGTNYDVRFDKTSYLLTYPSRPLVDTRLINFLQLDKVPSGQQISVAILTYTGYNQEDSLLINRGSIERGLFSATIYHTEKDEDKNQVRDEIVRCRPNPQVTRGIKMGSYEKIDKTGFAPENTFIENRDVIIAKTVPIKEHRNDQTKTIKFEDQSRVYRTNGEHCYVDKSYCGRNGDGYGFAKMRLRTFSQPEIGDKFASRAGQKGTLGLIVEESNMPFTKDGMVPDLILNPHAIPSRMTVAQLRETLMGPILTELGIFGDSTAFQELSVEDIMQELQRLGFEKHGNQILYDGHTGQQLEASVFFHTVHYQKLKHLVAYKVHSRANGAVTALCRQPSEGRSRDGGFRVGEMERDVLLGHGISAMCRDRLLFASDKFEVFICSACGMIPAFQDSSLHKPKIQPHRGGNGTGTGTGEMGLCIHSCKTCGNLRRFKKIVVPYAFLLLSSELQAINVRPRFLTE